MCLTCRTGICGLYVTLSCISFCKLVIESQHRICRCTSFVDGKSRCVDGLQVIICRSRILKQLKYWKSTILAWSTYDSSTPLRSCKARHVFFIVQIVCVRRCNCHGADAVSEFRRLNALRWRRICSVDLQARIKARRFLHLTREKWVAGYAVLAQEGRI